MHSSDLFNETCVDLLRDGYGVSFRAGGASMHPNIRNGELITVQSVSQSSISIGDILLYRSRRGVIAHRVEKIARDGGAIIYTLRGDSADSSDDPVLHEQVVGKVIAVERNGKTIRLDGAAGKLMQSAARAAFRLKQRIMRPAMTRVGGAL